MTTPSASLLSSTKRSLEEITAVSVGKLADAYGFPLEEALQKLYIGDAPPPRKKAHIRQAPSPPSVPLPFCGAVVAEWCHGVRFNRGLFTQCTNAPKNTKALLCGTCAKVSTRPVSCGDILERSDVNWRDRRGRKPVKYSTVVTKLGIDRAVAEAEAQRLGWTIAESEFGAPGTPRRGRPPKEKPIVTSIGNNLLDQLVADARAMTITEPKPAEPAPTGETQKQKFHRLFGSDSDSDAEIEEDFAVSPIFIAGKEYLHCSATSAVYDLHTQAPVGKLSSDGTLTAR